MGRIVWKYHVLRTWLNQNTTHVNWRRTYTTDFAMECQGNIVFHKKEEQEEEETIATEESEVSDSSDEEGDYPCHNINCNEKPDKSNSNCCKKCRIPCLNHEFCKGDTCTDLIHIHHNLCMNCEVGFHFGLQVEKLTIIDAIDPCHKCQQNVTRKIVFPGSCSHSFCFSCFDKIFYVDVNDYCLSVEGFGCPPCPNGCKNPDVGKQCSCNEYEPIKNMWKRIRPDKEEEHDLFQDLSQNNRPDPKGKCHVCNAEPPNKRQKRNHTQDK
jgi:hypothetical protein